MKFPDFEYLAPATIDEVVQVLAEAEGNAKVIAGGQSLLPTMAFRLAQPGILVDIGHLPDLRSISVEPGFVRIGALNRWRDIEDSDLVKRELPLLAEAIRHIAHYQVRNRGTIGGSLAHADPAAEMPCMVLTCDATLVVRGVAGERTIPAKDFFLGSLTTALANDEILTEILFPRWSASTRWAFREFSRRSGDFAMAGCAVLYDAAANGQMQSVRLGAFGVGPTPLRLVRAEALLEGRLPSADHVRAAAEEAGNEVSPLDDLHASAAYRRSLLSTLVAQAIAAAAH